MSNVPHITEEERAAALEKAMETRLERSRALKALKEGKTAIKEAIDMPILARAKVSRFITSCPGLGKTSATRIMLEVGIAENRRVGGLGARQKAALLERLCGGEE